MAFKFCKSWRVFDDCFWVKKRVSSSNGAAIASQRARRHVATGPPLQGNSSPVATPRGPYGKPKLPLWGSQRGPPVCKWLYDNQLQNRVVFRLKNHPIFSFVRFENSGARPKNFGKWAWKMALNSEFYGQKLSPRSVSIGFVVPDLLSCELATVDGAPCVDDVCEHEGDEEADDGHRA